MCGFVAVIGQGQPVEQKILSTMRDRLAHRGPDGAANWRKQYDQGSVSFGFRRLAILDLRRVADQPMVSEDGRKVIVFNGEIYNYVELRRELEQAGYTFRTRSDTEVLLRAYEKWGEGAIERLNGMFAFIIWDEICQEALIVRDRFGEKPLYFCRLENGALAFASEVKALTACPDAPCELDTRAISDVLAGDILFAKERTIFSKIEQFRPAYKMVVGINGSVRKLQRYWQPNYDRKFENRSRSDLIEEFRSHLERSTHMRTRSDVPIGANLSGGIDSSALVSILSDLTRTNKARLEHAVSARFPYDPTLDEGLFIDQVLEQTGLTGASVTPTPADLLGEVRRLHWHQETVVAGISMFLEWAVFSRAKELGYKVMLDGQGADEIVAGYSIYLQAFQAELFANGQAERSLEIGRQRDDMLRSESQKYVEPERRFAIRESLTAEQLAGFRENHVATMRQMYGIDGMPSATSVGELRFELALNILCTSLPSNTFSGDRNSMAHNIECRYPYLDYELVDFCCSLPNEALIDQGWSKMILRQSMEGRIPDDICWRVDKVGFAGPFDKWWKDRELKEWLSEHITGPQLESLPTFDRVRAEKMLSDHLEGTIDYSSDLWRLASAAELLEMAANGNWREGIY